MRSFTPIKKRRGGEAAGTPLKRCDSSPTLHGSVRNFCAAVRGLSLLRLLLAATRFAGFLGIAMIIILSVIPGEFRPDTGFSKIIEHAVAYLLVSAMLTVGGVLPRPALLLAALSALLEMAQFWIPGRTPALADFFASSTGAFLGTELALFGLACLSGTAESHAP